MSDPAHTYQVSGVLTGDGTAILSTRRSSVVIDSSPSQGEALPGPADLLTAAFAAGVLKNVERFGEILGFDWRGAHIAVTAERQDKPPMIIRLTYRLEITTPEPAHRLDLLHRNLSKFGTIYNTVAAVADVHGEVVAIAPGAQRVR